MKAGLVKGLECLPGTAATHILQTRVSLVSRVEMVPGTAVAHFL
jgi:hypothetical protein